MYMKEQKAQKQNNLLKFNPLSHLGDFFIIIKHTLQYV
jgi:hypothetical protein